MISYKQTYRTFLGAAVLFFTLPACTGNDVPAPESLLEQDEMPVCWSVQSEKLEDSRALIENSSVLQNACSNGKAIGIWSAYQLGEDNIVTHVLGTKEDVSLIYDANTTWDNWEGWTYGEKAAVWKLGVTYYFHAYFPKTGGMTGMNHTKVSIEGKYDTETNKTLP